MLQILYELKISWKDEAHGEHIVSYRYADAGVIAALAEKLSQVAKEEMKELQKPRLHRRDYQTREERQTREEHKT